MEAPVLKVERYEGPLDLLLALIAKHKIDIFDIPIAVICEQYIAYLDAMRSLDVEIAGEFIVMAAELMLIKSRMLLPVKKDEEDPRKQLVDALLEHQKAVWAASLLRERSDVYYDRFTKPADVIGDGTYTRSHAVTLLYEAMARIEERAALARDEEERTELFRVIEDERYYTVAEKTNELKERFSKDGETEFLQIFNNSKSRGEIIALFLALLEGVAADIFCVIKRRNKIFVDNYHGGEQ